MKNIFKTSFLIIFLLAIAANSDDIKKNKDEKSISKNPGKQPSKFVEATLNSTSSESKATTSTLSSDTKKDTYESARKFMKKLEEKNSSLTTLIGKFSQVKKQKIFLEEIKSEGIFYFKKPGKFRCDYLPPNEVINYLIDNTAYIYVPENKQVDKYNFNPEDSQLKQLNQLLLGFGVSVNDIEKVYKIDSDQTLASNEKQVVIILVPKEKDTSYGIERIHIWFDGIALKPIKLMIYEDSGDETTIVMKDVQFNSEIPDSKFAPKFPKDVEIIEQN